MHIFVFLGYLKFLIYTLMELLQWHCYILNNTSQMKGTGCKPNEIMPSISFFNFLFLDFILK